MNLAPWALTTRRIVGVARIILAVGIFAAVATQVGDRLANDLFRPGEYFAFFTIHTALMFVVILIAAGIVSLRTERDTRLLTIMRMMAIPYAIVTALVYNFMLRGLPLAVVDAGYEWPVWPNELLHVAAPILLVVDWVFSIGRYPLRLRALWWALIFPLAWVAFSIVRGLATGWWPYPFLDPNGSLGWLGVIGYIIGIAGAMTLFAYLTVLVGRIWLRIQARRA
jgi:hypothetical protein